MSTTTYNRVQIGVVDSSGNVNIIKPNNSASDVDVTVPNTGFFPSSANTVQKVINSLGSMAFCEYSDFSNGRCLLQDIRGVISSNYGFTYDNLSSLLVSGNFRDKIKNGDYITILTTNGEPLLMRANIDTYYNTGPDGSPGFVSHHIDFISETIPYSTITWKMNSNAMNNGVSSNHSPYIVSSLKSSLQTFLISNFSSSLQNHIVDKYVVTPGRYKSTGNLTDDNEATYDNIGKLWIPYEYEIFGSCRLSTKTTSNGFRQYQIFNTRPDQISKFSLNASSPSSGILRPSWWTASACSGDATSFCAIEGSSGGVMKLAANQQAGVCIGFRFV